MKCPGRVMRSVALRYRRDRLHRRCRPENLSAGRLHGSFRRVADEPYAALGGHGPEAREAQLARLEAVLFLGREPLGSRRLAQLADLADGTKARTLVRKLARMYDVEGCAFCVVEVAGGFQLMSRPKFSPWLRRLQSSPVQVCLSAPAMDTLSVVAYRQPVLRATIESTRGVQCGEILRQLMERELVRIVGRSEELGRPFLYGTTKRFLQVFGLRHLDDLPSAGLSRSSESSSSTRMPPDTEEHDTREATIMQSVDLSQTEKESTVKTEADTTIVPGDPSGVLEPEAIHDDANEYLDDDTDELEDEDCDEEEDEEEDEEDWEDEEEEEWEDDDEEEGDDDEWEEVPEDDEDEDGDEDEDEEEYEDEDDEEYEYEDDEEYEYDDEDDEEGEDDDGDDGDEDDEYEYVYEDEDEDEDDEEE